jgi:hypothetical protein
MLDPREAYHSLHIVAKLSLNLPCPNNRSTNRWEIPHLSHLGRRRAPIRQLELIMQFLYIILNALDQLILILLYRTSNLWADKQRIELAKHAEHFVCIFSGSETITERRNNLILNTRHAVILRVFRCDPDLCSFCSKIQNIDRFNALKRHYDILNRGRATGRRIIL